MNVPPQGAEGDSSTNPADARTDRPVKRVVLKLKYPSDHDDETQISAERTDADDSAAYMSALRAALKAAHHTRHELEKHMHQTSRALRKALASRDECAAASRAR
eukprot:6207938-Pleurochrysis_carterae.AAC.1